MCVRDGGVGVCEETLTFCTVSHLLKVIIAYSLQEALLYIVMKEIVEAAVRSGVTKIRGSKRYKEERRGQGRRRIVEVKFHCKTPSLPQVDENHFHDCIDKPYRTVAIKVGLVTKVAMVMV